MPFVQNQYGNEVGAEVSEVSEQTMKQNRPTGTFLSRREGGATAIVRVGLGLAFPKG